MSNKLSFHPFPILHTDRLTLRRLSSKDAASVYFLRTDPEVNRYIQRPQPKNLKEAQDFINKINTGIDQNKNIYWSITRKEEDEMIGSISLWHFSEDKITAEVGYDLNTTCHNQGYMSEALSAIILYGFNELRLGTITAYTHYANKSSINLLRKHGFNLLKDLKDPDNENNIVFSLSKQCTKNIE